jgi:hypothetical protein
MAPLDGPILRLNRDDAVGCRAAACRRAVSPKDCGPATSAGPNHHSVIAGIIRKARSDCMSHGLAVIDPFRRRVLFREAT